MSYSAMRWTSATGRSGTLCTSRITSAAVGADQMVVVDRDIGETAEIVVEPEARHLLPRLRVPTG